MTMPLENHQPRDPIEDRRLERLVDGELPDAERRQLLLLLDTEPDGWRRCALAFLENQTWRATFRPLATPASTAVAPALAPPALHRTPAHRRLVTRLAALAAGLAAAFALGWAVHGSAGLNAPDPRFTIIEPSPSAPPFDSDRPSSPDLAAASAQPSADPLDPVVKQWESRGYRAERQKRLVSVELQDGRKLDVPVNEVRFQYVRGRTY
jgi:hypothetical protein